MLAENHIFVYFFLKYLKIYFFALEDRVCDTYSMYFSQLLGKERRKEGRKERRKEGKFNFM